MGESFQMDIDAIQASIDGIDNHVAPVRVEYTDSSGEEDNLDIGSLDASNPYLNFSYMNLPNLQALSQENFVKNSPRLMENDRTIHQSAPSSLQHAHHGSLDDSYEIDLSLTESEEFSESDEYSDSESE